MTMTTPDSPSASYEVGYGKPPKHTQFRKGQSGNPGGRPKRRESLERMKALVLQEAYRGINVGGAYGRLEASTVIQVIVRKQMELAMSGNLQAQRAVMAMIQGIEKDQEFEARSMARHGMDEDDQDLEEPDPDEPDLNDQDPDKQEGDEQNLKVQTSDEPDLDEPASEGRNAEEADAAPAYPRRGAASQVARPPSPSSPSEDPPAAPWPQPAASNFGEPRRFRAPSEEPPVIPWSQRPAVPWRERFRKPPAPPRPDRYTRRRDEF
jgi:hypothetical protein